MKKNQLNKRHATVPLTTSAKNSSEGAENVRKTS